MEGSFYFFPGNITMIYVKLHVKENNIGSAVSKILQYTHSFRLTSILLLRYIGYLTLTVKRILSDVV